MAFVSFSCFLVRRTWSKWLLFMWLDQFVYILRGQKNKSEASDITRDDLSPVSLLLCVCSNLNWDSLIHNQHMETNILYLNCLTLVLYVLKYHTELLKHSQYPLFLMIFLKQLCRVDLYVSSQRSWHSVSRLICDTALLWLTMSSYLFVSTDENGLYFLEWAITLMINKD